MKRPSTTRLASVLALMFLVTASVPSMPVMADGRAYTPHANIAIASDADFTAANGVTGGTGTPADPFVIRGWQFDVTTMPFVGISIQGTSSHFKIDGCKFSGASGLGAGVSMSSCSNGVISSSVFSGMTNGIASFTGSSLNFSSNTFTGNINGIAAQDYTSLAIWGNSFSEGKTGIALNNGSDAELSANSFTSVPAGVNIANLASSIQVHDNLFEKGATHINIANSTRVKIKNNEFMNATSAAVRVGQTFAGIEVCLNDFKNNNPGGKQADTISTNATFYNSSLGKGNHWSDWTGPDANGDGIVDAPYVVTASIASDEFPLVNPLVGPPTVKPLAVTLGADRLNGTAPLTVTFTATVTGGTGPYTHNVSYGDGSSGSSMAHTFGTAGTYVVSDTVRDSKGLSKVSNGVSISVNAPLNVTVAATRSAGNAPMNVGFTSTVNGGVAPYNYTWDFGDGQVSNEANPTHSFKKAGTYDPKLTVRDASGTEKSKTIRVTATKPAASKGFMPGFEAAFLAVGLLAALVLAWRRKQ